MGAVLIAGLVLGLTSNFHCLGMCGPIALMIPLDRSSNAKVAGGLFQYHLGRIAVYAVLGFAFGAIGLTMRFIGWLQWLSIISGAILIVYAWWKYRGKSSETSLFGGRLFKLLQKIRTWALNSNSPFKLFILGTVNGLLPCGMVYVALVNAVLADSYLTSGLAMTLFGVGTMPILLAVSIFGNKMKSFKSVRWSKIAPYMITIVGLLIMLRGMNLGIKFISPKISMIEKVTEQGQKEEVQEMSCCHSTSESCESK